MGTAPHRGASDKGGLQVITLASARTPMPLRVPFGHELEGLTVFRSFSGEGDAALYHLHVGYFADEPRARQALEIIRKYFAFASIEPAPHDGMGSLEDTLNSDFRVLRSPPVAPAVAAPAAPPVAQATARRKAAAKPVQLFAVLLARRAITDDVPPIPRLPAFAGFNIYAVRASNDDGDCQDIRLGFFQHVELARHFADSIRSHFPQAAALPVSAREHARVSGMGSGRDAGVQRSAPRPDPGTRPYRARSTDEGRIPA